jgi:hypothetical protein
MMRVWMSLNFIFWLSCWLAVVLSVVSLLLKGNDPAFGLMGCHRRRWLSEVGGGGWLGLLVIGDG